MTTQQRRKKEYEDFKNNPHIPKFNLIKLIFKYGIISFIFGFMFILICGLINPIDASQEASLQPWEITIASNICDSMTLDQIKNNSLSADEAKDFYNICMFSYNKTGLDVDEETVRYYIHQYLTLESDNSTRL